MSHKYFTVDEANKTLVFVKPIVSDIIIKRKKMVQLKKTIRDLQVVLDEKIRNDVSKLSADLKLFPRRLLIILKSLRW